MDYIPRDNPERQARDSFRVPLIRTGQGSYVKDYDPSAGSRLVGRVVVICAVVAALCGAAWMVTNGSL